MNEIKGSIKDTPTLRLALKAIRDDPRIMPGWLAFLMWPDSPAWRRSSKAGIRGAAIKRAAGGYLGKMRNAGLIRESWDSDRKRWLRYLTACGHELADSSQPK